MALDIIVQEFAAAVTVLLVTGRLDSLTAGELRDRVVSLVETKRHKIVIDLAKVGFIDSSGIGALIGGLKAARVAGGDLRIARASEQARLVLALTTLDKVFKLYESVPEATADF